MKSASFCSANTGICTREMKSSARAGSWTWPVGDGLFGRVINPFGRPLDGNGPVVSSKRLPIERPAPPIMDRAPVTVPLQTGIKVIDALIPVGRGQRELILGDRQTGKTAIAIDTILNQRDQDVAVRLLCHRSARVRRREGRGQPCGKKARWITPSSS